MTTTQSASWRCSEDAHPRRTQEVPGPLATSGAEVPVDSGYMAAVDSASAAHVIEER